MSRAGFGAFAQGFASSLKTGMELYDDIKRSKEERAVEDALKEASADKRIRGESRDLTAAAADYGITPEELAKAKKPDEVQALFKGRQKLSNPQLNVAQDQPDVAVGSALPNLGGIPTGPSLNRRGEVVGTQGAADMPEAPQPTRTTALPSTAYPEVTNPDRSQWGKRPDGSAKGDGWLGVRQRPDGGVSSELSAGFEINGKETEIPLMVPGLSRDEMDYLMKTPADKVMENLPDSIKQKALAHAEGRIADGKSPFRQSGEALPAPIQDVPAQQPKKPPHVYVDEFGRTRVAEEYDDLPRSQILTKAADKLMEKGLADQADALYERADKAQDRELKQDHNKFVKNLNGVRVALQQGDTEAVNTYMKGLIGSMDDAHDGFNYKFNKLPDGTLQLVGTHASTGLPFPSPSGEHNGVIAQFKGTPEAPAEFQMVNFLSSFENFDTWKQSVQTNLSVQDAIAKKAKADIEMKYLPREKELGIAKDEESIAASKDRRALDRAQHSETVRHNRAMEARESSGGSDRPVNWQQGSEKTYDAEGNVTGERQYAFNPRTKAKVYDNDVWGFPVAKQWADDRNSYDHMARQAKARGLTLDVDDYGRPFYADPREPDKGWYTAPAWDKEHGR